ncbi:MAG: hypothetical protein JSU63_00555 [Phycisphaerales bacterium]|nr:MAG: hypothetical protein JSU63_00555 [Phycisphaerales bacterium]
MSQRNANESSRTSEEASPCVDAATFREIVEGRQRCPTIKQLACFVEREAQDLDLLPDQLGIQQHLAECLDCADLCAAIRSVAAAAECAVERTITGLSTPSP